MTPTNAVLVAVHAPGPVDLNGLPSLGPAVWTGRAAGYIKRTTRTARSQGQSVRVQLDVLIIRRAAAVPTLPAPGSTWSASVLEIEDRRTGTAVRRRFRVAGLENRAAGTIADSLRIDLTEEVTV